MKKGSKPKIHHYAPQFLLKDFSEGKKPQIWVFNKSTGKPFKTHIKNIAAGNRFYDFALGDKQCSLEDWLGEVEGPASSIIKRIVKQASLIWITVNENCYPFSYLHKWRAPGNTASDRTGS